MQEVTAMTCYSVSEGATGTLVDIRDGKSYRIAKLKDGRCWMTQNMNYTDGGLHMTHNNSGYQDAYGAYYNYDNAIKVCAQMGNWDLPSNNLFIALMGVYNITNNTAGSMLLRGEPLDFGYGGYVGGSSLIAANSNGYYWSSTTSGDSSAYSLDFNSNTVNPSGSHDWSGGFSVRCVMR